MGKGSKRRKENFKQIQQNWDEISWSKLDTERKKKLGAIIQSGDLKLAEGLGRAFFTQDEYDKFREEFIVTQETKWKCKRCGCMVVNFKCGCKTSPSPWEPI